MRYFLICFVFALSACLGREGFKTTSSLPPTHPEVPMLPVIGDTRAITVQVEGVGQVNILEMGFCEHDCTVNIPTNHESQLQADNYDLENGGQLVWFGCDLIIAESICQFTANTDRTISVRFSKPPVADFIRSDQGSIVYISLFDGDGNALASDPDGTIASFTIVSSSGDAVLCALNGDLNQTAQLTTCLEESDHYLVLEVDGNLTNLSITLTVTDNLGFSSTFTDVLR